MHAHAQLALDTIHRRPTRGIPSWLLHVMEHAPIERLAGAEPGAYRRDPEAIYLAMQRNIGTCLLDQWIPTNPLSMGGSGFDRAARGATEGVGDIVVDGLRIDSPEAVVAHLERFVFPALRRRSEEFDETAEVNRVIAQEQKIARLLGPTILKSGYGFVQFPKFDYSRYGYEMYFMALALYPEVIERHFSLQADVALKVNAAAARAIRSANLPPLVRLDHDMADSRGTLTDVRFLDRRWFPHLARCLAPLLDADVRLIWHCDGNLMAMVPRLLEVGLHGFQGFQYEDGMDYQAIGKMKTRRGEGLLIIAGVSVTRTLPRGTPDDVRQELRFLVEHGPGTGLFLAASSSIAPGTPWENIAALVEGLRYYRQRGRDDG